MFTRLRKQAWFVLLMVFAIGWSGVSIASVKTMHITMQMQHEPDQQVSHVGQESHQKVSAHESVMQGMSVQEIKNHCMDLQQQVLSDHTDLNHKQQIQSLKDCHTQLIQTQQAQHASCQDCTLFSCQSSIVWFNADIPELSPPDHLYNLSPISKDYKAQHLAGHWQEILRPPKA